MGTHDDPESLNIYVIYMEHYMENYDNFKKQIVYYLSARPGGVGDILKYFIILLEQCVKHNIRLYFYSDSIVNKFLKFKCEKMKISKSALQYTKKITNITELHSMDDNVLYSIDRGAMFSLGALRTIDSFFLNINISLSDFFEFDEHIVVNSNRILNTDEPSYISIHIRLGDSEIESINKSIHSTDKRLFNEHTLFNFIEHLKDDTILLCCDSSIYKNKLKEKYNKLTISDFKITHTGEGNPTEIEVFNTITEFYLLAKSKKIYMTSDSGFPLTAALFYKTPISKIHEP